MWNPFRKKQKPVVVESGNSDSLPEIEERRRLLKEFIVAHQPIIDKYRFCPVTGRSLTWKFDVIDARPFDTRTGKGVPTVVVEVMAAPPFNRCLYTYYPESRKLEIWNGPAGQHERFD